ncbi:MAG: hypothetical protein WCO35_00785 [Candidatus Nomurabacteria bacterium]
MDKRQSSSDQENYNLLMAKKTEKIVTAIYLVSQFLSREENVKHDLRKEANQLLKNINAIAYTDSSEDDSKNIFAIYKLSLDNVTLLISYLFVARNANLISKMNADIVIEGLRVLENILIKKQFNFSREDILIQEEELFSDFNNNLDSNKNSLTSFDVLTERNLISNTNVNEKNKNLITEKIVEKLEKSSDKNIENISEGIVNKEGIFTIKETDKREKFKEILKEQSINDIINSKRQTPEIKLEKQKIATKTVNNFNRKNNRKDQILSLFTKGVEVSINDIAKKVVGCSTKTLQRELNNLLQENKIKRIGDKRWSKYILG